MAKKSEKSEASTNKTLNLSTAKVSTGEIKYGSVYEIMGRNVSPYKATSYGEYQKQLQKMNLPALHEHAYEVGVIPTDRRENMIDRLEQKYLELEGKKAAAVAYREQQEKVGSNTQMTVEAENALKSILKKGRPAV